MSQTSSFGSQIQRIWRAKRGKKTTATVENVLVQVDVEVAYQLIKHTMTMAAMDVGKRKKGVLVLPCLMFFVFCLQIIEA